MFSYRSIVTFLITVAIVLPRPLCANESTAKSAGRPLKSSTGAVLRSIAIPGWGQFYTENYWKAAGFLVFESSFLISISRNHDLMMRFKTGRNPQFERFHRNQRNRSIWWLAGFVLLAMGDSYVNAHMYRLDFTPDLETNDDGELSAPGIRATLHF